MRFSLTELIVYVFIASFLTAVIVSKRRRP